MLVGLGYDIHRLKQGGPLVLAGVRIDYEAGLAGHSDADAALHAVTDAVLGAAGAGDIGEHFPDDDPRWKDADSKDLLRRAVEIAAEAGLRVVNCDVTVVAERPKLSPHKQGMRESIAGLLGVGVERVSVKAKTNEGLDAVGRGEAISATAAVLLDGEQ